MVQLTDEQQRIVQHDRGPAIVYAVAGAGKSTTMAHRVRYLAQQRGVPPARILVCSFSRETVGDIRRKIEGLGVHGVSCLTFNALGRRILHRAIDGGHWPAFDESEIESRPAQLAMRALLELSRQQGRNFAALDVNPEDLQTWISICKGNLRYPWLAQADLPPEALHLATQAEHENPYYLEAYRLYEQQRRQRNLITFDDQLLLGWEALMRFPEVRDWLSGAWDYLMVDEFQDVNLVQSALAELITEKHRNYMAIGDDDQCIYEWRGAAVRFILDFKSRHQAAEYTISDNFRCPGEATLLAGKVIAANLNRHAKDIVASKGFGGDVLLRGFADERALARHLVAQYQAFLGAGGKPEEAVVLVRSYAQTPSIEARLIEEGLPYRVVGSQRFYERPEVKILFTYLGFARQERDLLTRDPVEPSEQYLRRFSEIIKVPNRYLTNHWLSRLCDEAVRRRGSVISLLEAGAFEAENEGARKRLAHFIRIMRGLQQRLQDPAAETLSWLVDELNYLEYLKKSAGVAEQGEERSRNVRALIAYARRHGDVARFLNHLRDLHAEEATAERDSPRLQLMSIHRAKGLQWPMVFVPSCADDQLPGSAENLEEERRLLYVAITRTQRALQLLFAPENAMSRFLRDSAALEVLGHADSLRRLLEREEGALKPEDAILLAVGVRKYPLQRYLTHWWRPTSSQRRALRQQLHLALARQPDAILQQERAAGRAEVARDETADRESLARRLKLFRDRPLMVRLMLPPEAVGRIAEFHFEASGGVIRVLTPDGRHVGEVDPASRFPLDQVSRWDWVKAGPAASLRQHLSPGGKSLFLNALPKESATPTPTAAQNTGIPPLTAYLASRDFNEDVARLMAYLEEPEGEPA